MFTEQSVAQENRHEIANSSSANFAEEVNPSLAKPQPNFNGGLTEHGLPSLSIAIRRDCSLWPGILLQ